MAALSARALACQAITSTSPRECTLHQQPPRNLLAWNKPSLASRIAFHYFCIFTNIPGSSLVAGLQFVVATGQRDNTHRRLSPCALTYKLVVLFANKQRRSSQLLIAGPRPSTSSTKSQIATSCTPVIFQTTAKRGRLRRAQKATQSLSLNQAVMSSASSAVPQSSSKAM